MALAESTCHISMRLPIPLRRCGGDSIICALLVASNCLFALPAWCQTRPQPIEVVVGQRQLVGSPLAHNETTLYLLRPDGRLTQIDRRRIETTTPSKHGFTPANRMDLHRQLSDEFGRAYQVSVTAHFVVVHPPGPHAYWAEPFERLLHQLIAYFERRGWDLPRPEFPLVAVVLNTREEFDRFLMRSGTPNRQVVGYYSPISNRLITYRDEGESDGRGVGFRPSATIVHEVTHQAAFNLGLHSRFAETPRWLSEGLAIMFEARGVHNSVQYGSLGDRRHDRQWKYLHDRHAAGALSGRLRELIQDDRLFVSEPELAYALAWGLTFYLAETRNTDYLRLLRTSAARSDFQPYPTAERIRDVQTILGAAPDEWEPRVWNYLFGAAKP